MTERESQQLFEKYWLALDKLELGGESPLTMRAWCSAFCHFPGPLGIVTAEQLDKLELVYQLSKLEFTEPFHQTL